MLSCLTANDGTQILIAGVTSALYSLTMVVVIVGLIIDAVNSQFCSVSTYFFTYVVGIFILSAICHPREIKNVFYGIIYFLAVPSTSMLMMLYALGNLHVTSWGTREGKKNANKDKRLREEVTDGYTCSCFGLFSCTCMPKTKTTTNTKRTKYYQCTCCDKRFASEKLMREHECRHVKCHQCSHCDKRFTKQSQLKYHECVKVKCCYKCSACEKYLSTKRNLDDHVREHHRDNHECSHCVKTFTTERRLREHVRQDHRNECKILSHDTFEKETFFSDEISNELDQTEIVFWKWLIDNILYVENIKEEKKEEISSDLIVLRNTVYFAFFLANGIYVTLVFVLAQINEMNDEKFTVKLPCPNRDGDFEVDPISIVFTLTFGIVLLIQFYGMLLHRFSTFVHIMAVTRIIKDASEEYDPTKRPKEESKNNQIHLFSPTEKLMQLTPIEKPTLEKFAEEIEKDINSQPEKMYKDRFIETPLRKTLKSFVSYMEKQTLESSTTSSTIHDKNQ